MQHNPWLSVPEKRPYVLAEDVPYVREFNRQAKECERIETHLMPEPFFGRRDASVVILLLNPGLSSDDYNHHKNRRFAELLLADLHSPNPAQHFHLSDPTRGPGHRWWSKQCMDLINDVGLDCVSRGLLSIEFSPYHSRCFTHAHMRLPSQVFGFELVRQAIARQAHILCMRGLRIWAGAVPELGTYQNLLVPRSNRTAAISPGNLLNYPRIRNEFNEA